MVFLSSDKVIVNRCVLGSRPKSGIVNSCVLGSRPKDAIVNGCVLGSRPKSGSFSSSGQSESSAGGPGGASSGNETEEGELKARHLLVANHGSNGGQRVLVKIRPPQLPARQHREASCSTDGRQSSDEDDDDDDDDEEEEEEAEEGDSNSSGHDSPAGRSVEGIPRPIPGVSNLKMRIVAPDRRRVVSRPCVPQGNLLARSEADLFSGGQMHLPMMSRYGTRARQRRKLVRLRQQLAPDDEVQETGQMPESEDSVMNVHQAAEHGGVCPSDPVDEDADADNNDDDVTVGDDDDDDDEDDDEEESLESSSSELEWTSLSSPTGSSEPAVDQSSPAKTSRRRHGENLNSDEEGTPKRKRSKSDVDAGKMQSRKEAEVAKDIASKEADAAEPAAADQGQMSASASLQDNVPLSQVNSIQF